MCTFDLVRPHGAQVANRNRVRHLQKSISVISAQPIQELQRYAAFLASGFGTSAGRSYCRSS